jgi:small subunit ribosomal protein S29
MHVRAVGSCSTFREVRPLFPFIQRNKLTCTASEWIQSKSEYHYNSSTKSFNQSALSLSILESLLTINPQTLSSINSTTQISNFKSGTSLAEICRLASKSPAGDLVAILEGVLETLAKQTEVPVLMAIDEAQALFSTSGVRTPDYKILESYHLSTPKLTLDYITGKKSFVRLSSCSHSIHSYQLKFESNTS